MSQEEVRLSAAFEPHIVKHRGLHRMWRLFGPVGDLQQQEGLKNAISSYISVWGIGATLVMTVCFALLMFSPDRDPDPNIFLLPDARDERIARHLFFFYNILSVWVSVRAIREIAYSQEDIALIPASLTSEYLVALQRSGNIVGPAGSHGPHRWTTFSLYFLRSAGLFLLYTMHGPVVALYAVGIFALVYSAEVASNNARSRVWRHLEWAAWSQSAKEATFRGAGAHANEGFRQSNQDEFDQWAEGGREGAFWLGGGRGTERFAPGAIHVLAYWCFRFPLEICSEIFSFWALRIFVSLACSGCCGPHESALERSPELEKLQGERAMAEEADAKDMV